MDINVSTTNASSLVEKKKKKTILRLTVFLHDKSSFEVVTTKQFWLWTIDRRHILLKI